MISIERSFYDRFPQLAVGRARTFTQPVVELLRKIAGEERIRAMLEEFGSLSGFDFVERTLEHFGARYRLANTDRDNIPAEGRLVIVANHPLGAMDALSLLHLVGTVRRDVRILGNDVLTQLPLSSLLLPVNVFGGEGTSSGRLRTAYRALKNEEALIVFPAGEVSRMGPQGVRDARWSHGFVRLAQHAGAPVLPVHIAAYNSPTFYGLSLLSKPMSSLLLAREAFGAARGDIGISVGEMVSPDALQGEQRSPAKIADAMRRHVYQLARRRPTVFRTSRAIAHPESPLALRDALKRADVLGSTTDGKRILLTGARPDCPLLREIGRLRELAFRRVGEGTGTRRDLDRFDAHYQHLVLWDETALAIVGAYRLADPQIFRSRGRAGLYSSTLFDYRRDADDFLGAGVELGRSFIHPAFWGSRSLDYLWQGVGAYLRQRPDVRYLYGPVSISAAMPAAARAWIVDAHQHYFGDHSSCVRAIHPFAVPDDIAQDAGAVWSSRDVKAGLGELKRRLATMGYSIPTLYRHYVDLCEPDGVKFLAFGTDPAFAHCVDGLIRLDLGKLKPAKRERYLGGNNF